MLRLQPAQLRRPVTRMKATTGARMNLTLVEFRSQLPRRLRCTRVGPRQQRCRRRAIFINAHQTVPEGGDRSYFDACLTKPQRLNRPLYFINQRIRIELRKINKLTLRRRLRAFDLIAVFVKQRCTNT